VLALLLEQSDEYSIKEKSMKDECAAPPKAHVPVQHSGCTRGASKAGQMTAARVTAFVVAYAYMCSLMYELIAGRVF
jgi:hypothetical protein